MTALPFDVVNLAGDHAAHRSGGSCEFLNEADFPMSVDMRQTRHDFKGERAKSIAGENSDGIAEHFVARRPAAAKVVVIHGGKVVVDQRIGVDHFQRGSSIFDAGGCIGNGMRRSDGKNGTNPLTARKHAVAHGFVKRSRLNALGGKPAFESAVD